PAAAKSEQRFAARPTTPSEAKNESPSAPTDTAVSAPALAPAYPVTTSPASYPSTTAAPAYPQTPGPALQGPANAAPSYRSQFSAPSAQQPASQQPASQQVAPQPGAPPSGWSPPTGAYAPNQYQPMDNTARGPRSEFTGSGRH